MNHPQEGFAKDLYRELLDRFVTNPETLVDIEGAGVHWHCSASRGERSCLVHCFRCGGDKDPGAEYLVIFRGLPGSEPAGRTRVLREAVEAIGDWVDGRSVEDLHARFGFVDRRQRALGGIAAEAAARHPKLGRLVSSELCPISSDLYELWFLASDRSCRLSFYGHEEIPDAEFRWDECPQFHARTGDVARLSAALERWLCDLARPSEIASEFPEMEMEPVAFFYEQGRPVEGEFLVSWDRIERFYRDEARCPSGEPILDLIAEIRRAGFDRTLRAGQSLWTLMVSRSRRHGLRRGQPHVAFEFRAPSMVVIFEGRHHRERFTVSRIGLTPEVLAVLARLAAEPID